MIDETKKFDYNDLRPLLAEFDSMRQTLADFVRLIKHQDGRIKVLEEKLSSVGEIVDPHKVMQERFVQSCKHNRNLNEAPERIAFAAYLYYVKQIPAVHIAAGGVLSQSKMYGLTKWTTQHLTDFVALNGVSDIYTSGLEDEKIVSMVGIKNADILKSYVNKRDRNQTEPVAD